MNNQSTPRPWHYTGTSVSALNFCARWINGPDLLGQPAIAVGETAMEAEANADLIVKAVNLHDELVEALEFSRLIVNSYRADNKGTGLWTESDENDYKKIEQALSKAKEAK